MQTIALIATRNKENRNNGRLRQPATKADQAPDWAWAGGGVAPFALLGHQLRLSPRICEKDQRSSGSGFAGRHKTRHSTSTTSA
ncbi:MAG: hypothetical protein ACOYB1_15595 [Limnohabitans sp.]